MLTPHQVDVCQHAIQKYGEVHQTFQVTEEAGELGAAAARWIRDPLDAEKFDALKSEMADMYIMLRQLQVMSKIKTRDIEAEVLFKMSRLEDRLNGRY